MSDEGKLGQSGEEGEAEMDQDEFDESGEADLDDELVGSDGSDDDAEEEAKAGGADENDEDEEDGADEVADEDIETNIHDKRDAAIQNLLSKEDLGIIQMRIKETIKVLSNFKELRDSEKSR